MSLPKPYYEETGCVIYHGKAESILPELPAASIDLTVTSPPYDNLRTYNGYEFDFETIAKELYRVTKPGGVVVWVVGDATIDGSETGTSFRQALYFKDVCGFNLHDTMIYEKETFLPLTHKRYEQVFEYCFVLAKDRPKTFRPLMIRTRSAGSKRSHRAITATTKESSCWRSGTDRETVVKEEMQRPNIWSYPTATHCLHPAQFPEALASDHIRSWSNPGDIILDPMMGSGTTGKMARKNGRRFIGVDISEQYCEIAARRMGQGLLSFEETA